MTAWGLLQFTRGVFHLEYLTGVTHNLAPIKCGPLATEKGVLAKQSSTTTPRVSSSNVNCAYECKRQFHCHKGCSTSCAYTSLALFHYYTCTLLFFYRHSHTITAYHDTGMSKTTPSFNEFAAPLESSPKCRFAKQHRVSYCHQVSATK